jgi:hypothetical protein
VKRANALVTTAVAWLDTLTQHATSIQEQGATEALEDLEQSQPIEQEPTEEGGEANLDAKDPPGTPSVQNMFCVTFHSH